VISKDAHSELTVRTLQVVVGDSIETSCEFEDAPAYSAHPIGLLEPMAKKKHLTSSKPTKNDRFNFRIAAEEKRRFEQLAQFDGFDSLSTWFLWLARQREKELDVQPKDT
jgi:hypothetical protein